MKCPNCKNEAPVLLIDCTLPLGEARDRIRYCYACRPEAKHPYANCLPRVIHASNLPEHEKLAAYRARQFAPDHSNTYGTVERIIDLHGPVPEAIQ